MAPLVRYACDLYWLRVAENPYLRMALEITDIAIPELARNCTTLILRPVENDDDSKIKVTSVINTLPQLQ